MLQNTPREKSHAEIAKQIRLAKKAMFKRSREGMSLREAADRFVSDFAVRAASIIDSENVQPAASKPLNNDKPPADFYRNPAIIEHITEEILGFEDEQDRTAAAFVAVLDEIERLAQAGSTVRIQDLCSSLKISVYQSTRTCEAAAWAFAKSAHEGVQHA